MAERRQRSGRRRRPGRLRRWLLRPLLWMAAAIALLCLTLTLVARSDWARERARALLVDYLERKLGAPVTVDSLSFDLLPPAAELRGLEVGSGGSDSLPLATVPRLAVEANFEAFLRPSIRLRRVLVERPQVSLRWLEGGGDNLVRWRRAAAGGGAAALPVEVSIDVLQLSEGLLRVDDQTLPVELTAHGIVARLAGVAGEELVGSVRAGGVEVQLAGGRPQLDEVVLRTRIARGTVEVTTGRARTPGLDAEIAGSYRWGGGERELKLDVRARAAAALANRWDLFGPPVEGPLELDGGFAWQPQLWGFRGTVTSPSLRLFERGLADVVAVVSVDRNGGRVDLERAGYGAGIVRGGVTVGRARDGRPVDVDLELSGVRLSRLLADQGIPVTGVEGRVGGGFNYRFTTGAPDLGSGWAELEVSMVESPAEGVMTVRGTVPLGIAAGVISTRAARLASPTQQLVSDGLYHLGSGVGRFDYEIVTARLPELLAQLPLDTAEPPLWLPTAGEGRLEGTLHLTAGAVATDLRLDLVGVEAPGFSADRVRGSLSAGASAVERLRLELERPDAALLVVGELPLAGEIDLTIDAQGWPLDDLAAWLPAGVPAAGRVAGRLQLRGLAEALGGELRATCGPLELAGIDAGELRVDALFGNGLTVVREAVLTAAAGSVRLTGTVEEAADLVTLELVADSLDLAEPPFAELADGRLGGSLRLAAEVSGGATSPVVEARLEGSALTLAGRQLGTAAASLSWRQGRLQAEGSLLGLVDFQGGGRLDRESMRLEFGLATDDLEAIAGGLAPASLPAFEGSAAGVLAVAAEAPFGQPELRLQLDRIEAVTGEHSLVNLEPVVLEASRGGIEIRSLWLGEPNGTSELFVAGGVATGDGGGLDLKVQSTLDSDWLARLVPGVELRGGSFDAIASVAGTIDTPEVNGIGRLAGIRALVEGLPSSFEAVTAVVLFDPVRWVIDRAEADFAGGRVRMGGVVELDRGWSSPGYRLQFSAERLNLRYPEGWLVRGGGEGSLSSTPGGRLLTGRVELERATYDEPVQLGLSALLQGLFARERIEVEESSELAAETEINLEVRAPGSLRIRNNVADLEGSADLSIRGSLARPVLFGRVELVPGGELDYAGTEYEVERGVLTFANPYRIEPIVDLVARTELRDYDVVLNLSGTPERMQVNFTSDPPLADLEVLSLLTSGDRRPPGEGVGSVGAERFLYGQAASLLTERANRLFGLDKLRIDPLTGATGDLSSARVTLGKRLSGDLFVTYSYDPTTTKEEILELRWSVSRTMKLLLTQNGDGSYAVDVVWEKAF